MTRISTGKTVGARNRAQAHLTDQYGSGTGRDDPRLLDQHIDWELMEARIWADTLDEPDRKEKRMAELLVHRNVPWQVIHYVVTKDEGLAQRARNVLDSVPVTVPVHVERGWYF